MAVGMNERWCCAGLRAELLDGGLVGRAAARGRAEMGAVASFFLAHSRALVYGMQNPYGDGKG